MILVSVLVTVGLMTLFSVFYNYNHFYAESTDTSQSQHKNIRRKLFFDYFGFHMIYVINILTNQGKTRPFTSFRYLL